MDGLVRHTCYLNDIYLDGVEFLTILLFPYYSDREGENINFEVLDCCMHLMQSGGTSSNFDRVCKYCCRNENRCCETINSI